MSQRQFDQEKTSEEMDALWKEDIVKAGAMTEEQMRSAPDPLPKTPEQLSEYIAALVDRPHDYGTCVYAMSLAAVAAFNYVAHKLGVTGFQANCADLDIIRRTRSLKHGFTILDASNILYPQYNLVAEAREFVAKQVGNLKDAARELLARDGGVPDVRSRWQGIADGTYEPAE